MKTIIKNKLLEIEKSNQIKILYANESGSRAWGFPSPDSDYDVRFIYVKPMETYLSIKNEKDFMSFPINDELDVYGWDIKKVLQLVYKSNTTPFEWLQSPIVYMEQVGFKENLFALCQNYFNAKGNVHHYVGIAKNAFSSLNDNHEIKIKKLFYVLRSLLSAKWCVEKNKIAPMTIQELMLVLPLQFHSLVNELIVIKSTANEADLVKLDKELKDFIVNELEKCSWAADAMSKPIFDVKLLNQFFKETIT
jgi:predicted nucleotidyltransferase